VQLNPNFPREVVKDLEKFSHIWIIYSFHKASGPWHPLIDTPRVESSKVGIFATRAPKRPNPIGMSAVKLEKIEWNAKTGIQIHVSGIDILDQTPIFDIKPYLPYCDAIPEANSGWIEGDIKRYQIQFSEDSLQTLANFPELKELLAQILELDPRPTSQRRDTPIEAEHSNGEKFAFRLSDFDIHWTIQKNKIYVEKILTI